MDSKQESERTHDEVADTPARNHPLTDDLRTRFESQGYVPVREFLSEPLLSVAYRYVAMKHQIGFAHPDTQAATAPQYGDALMESILELAQPLMERVTGRKLWPTYAFYRWYQNGDILKPHKDRRECEISATLSLGCDVDDICKSTPDYAWPIFMDGDPVVCMPGDMAVYKGCEVRHWREAFEGQSQAQVFLHFVDQESPQAALMRFDGRSQLGMPPVDKMPKQTLQGLSESQQAAIVELQRQAQAARST